MMRNARVCIPARHSIHFGWVIAVCFLGLQQTTCDRKSEGEPLPAASSGSGAKEPSVAAGAMETALLDGLRVGDAIEGYRVTFIGAVGEQGVLALQLQSQERVMRLEVALDASEPRPPIRTSKYALYYVGTDRALAADAKDCLVVMQGVADRIRRVEQEVPTPTGMRVLGQPKIDL